MKTFDIEVKEKWGKTDAYKEYTEKTKNYSKDKWNNLSDSLNDIFAKFAVCMKNDKKPDSDEAQNLVKSLQNHITENYYLCTNEILSGLGQMYIADERFKNNIDKHADGTAQFISKAIKIYCNKLHTVEDFFNWRKSEKTSLEQMHKKKTTILSWDETDTLYSFLGIYTIGLKALHSDEFWSTKYQIRTEIDGKSVNAYSYKFLKKNYKRYYDLNDLSELKAFLNCYLSIGNLIPIWPGGNVHRGAVANCFDLPDIYFHKYSKMAKALTSVYENAFMEDILNSKHNDLSYYFSMDIDEYKTFLKRIVEVINKRTEQINKI